MEKANIRLEMGGNGVVGGSTGRFHERGEHIREGS